MNPTNTENEPVTDADLARVAELDNVRLHCGLSLTDAWKARHELASLCPRIARELAAAREKLKVARDALEEIEALPAWTSESAEQIKYHYIATEVLTQLNQP